MNPSGERCHADLVAPFRRANEVVERHVEALPRPTELLLHPIAIRQRIEMLLGGFLEYVLGVLVVAHQEARLDAAEPLIAGNDVSRDFLVRRSEMRTAVDVVDR